MNRKIFGREPSAIIAVLGPIGVFFAALNLPYLDAGQSAAIVAVLSSAVLVWTTRPLAPSLLTGGFAALVALGTEYQLHLSDQLVGAASGLILALFAFITRQQVSPQDTAITRASNSEGETRP